ncbi:hypothetical protein Csa_013037 [Cucumis sativus]|uniref:Uncharacterized protein n=1 Tax=Cucumis sativus TaxID=3659 RepID=A0A0A0LVT6_CUCSA|nr:hypothetical protein Csa_013037 [Cucumis sativus]
MFVVFSSSVFQFHAQVSRAYSSSQFLFLARRPSPSSQAPSISLFLAAVRLPPGFLPPILLPKAILTAWLADILHTHKIYWLVSL